jgi:EAL domain-containing protein (putative c-di-GMP-specific phosphodiesterase class I)
MVRAMNGIAHDLEKKTVAEFVEDENCFQLLREYGVDFAQVDHLGRPELIATADHSNSGRDATHRVVYLMPR